MRRRDKRGVVWAAPLHLNNPATAAIPRIDDEHRGPAVIDAYELQRCFIDLMERARAWPLPKVLPDDLKIRMEDLPAYKAEDWLRTKIARRIVPPLIINAMRTGESPVWVAHRDGPERLVAPSALVEVDEATVEGGCYHADHDRGWLKGRPLFVKIDDWVSFAGLMDRKHSPRPAPRNRQLDHDAIKQRAAELRAERPGIGKGSVAASIVQELPKNPKTDRHRDTRGIERIIAPLWEDEG